MKWLQFILSHSIFIAVCGMALAFQTSQLLLLNINLYVYGFIFFATICSYNFYWILSKSSFAEKISVAGIFKNEQSNLLVLFVAAAGLVFCLVRSGLRIDFIFTAMALTGLYAIPLLPFPIIRFTRKAGVLKTVLLAFTWAYVTAFIPIQKSYLLLNNADLFIISRRFLFMLMLCIIFDNRDKAVDKIRGLHSLATDLSPGVLKSLIYFIFAVLFISNLFYKDFSIAFNYSVGLQVSTLVLLVVYFYSQKKQGYFFYYFIVDGMMLFSALATFIAGI